MTHATFFTKALMQWHHQENFRSLPWKQEKDPYKIWLSEIILQQTRAEQGLPYYLRFIEAYPTVRHLAQATDEEVFRLWQGLGYYNRCKNLLSTARVIAYDMNGVFPNTYDEILKLKGIGSYTAAAVASFAYGLPYAVVDGNVNRVLSRFFGIDLPFDTTEGKKYFFELAHKVLDRANSASYNQAIMDLGATVCKPQNPLCDECLLKKNCFAYAQEMIGLLPVKSKKIVVKERFFNYYIFKCKDKVYIQKRTAKDIWQNLHEPFLLEGDDKLNEDAFSNFHLQSKPVEIGQSKQRLTHQIIVARFYLAEIKTQEKISENGWWVVVSELKNYAFPKTVVSFFKKIKLLLDD